MGSQPEAGEEMTFDLEILDSNITTKISRDAGIVFSHWPGANVIDKSILGPSQAVKKWRPSKNIALISNAQDLSLLTGEIMKIYKKNENIKSFQVLFQYDNILRLKAK